MTRTEPRIEVLGCELDALDMASTVARCIELVERREPAQQVSVNAVKLAGMQDPKLRRIVEEADLVSPDGQSVILAARMLGTPLPERIAGIDLMSRLLEAAAERGYPVYLLGGTRDVLERAVARIAHDLPSLRVAGYRDGYFGDDESPDICRQIAASGARILLIGIPSPRKEYWAADNTASLGPILSVGVGGAFDVLAGETARAPRPLQRAGLEWLFRVAQEPRRLGRRYLDANLHFAAILGRELVSKATGAPLVTFERRSAKAQVLVVTSMWPCAPVPGPGDALDDEPRGGPTYGIPVVRQVEALEEQGVRADVLFVRGYRSAAAYPRAAVRLLLLGLSRRYRLIHAFGGEAGLTVACSAGTSRMISYLGSDVLARGGRLRRWAIAQTARRAAATVAMTPVIADALPSSRRGRNAVIPLGIDLSFRPTDRGEARRRLGWPAGARIVLFASSPTRALKRFALAQAACARAGERIPGIRLEVASGVPHDEVPTLMNAADCLLLTSSSEGSPNVVREAMRCNLPVVSTDVGDVRELLAGVAPSFVCGDSPDELAAALVDCLEPPRRSNGSEQAAWFGTDVATRRLLTLYETYGVGRAANGHAASPHRAEGA